MRIAIDARWIFAQLSGIGTYTRELVRHLMMLDERNDYILLFDDPVLLERTSASLQLARAPRFTAELVDARLFSVRSQVILPRLLRRLDADVFHSPNYMIPLLAFPRGRAGRPRCVVTIHDVIPMLFPDHAPRSRKARLFPLYRMLMREVGARADAVITVSECSRRDAIAQLGIPEPRQGAVVAVPNGVGPEYRPVPRKERRDDTKTLLYVGRFDPYKNVPGLLRVFARVREKVRGKVALRIIGPADPRYPEAPRLASELGLDEHVRWSGYVAGHHLVEAYQQADAFVLLSKYEGFGLTVLEAMACGTPVVCSNRSSLPEVAGSAALQVDPDDVEGASAAIARVLDDATLAADLRERGIGQAARFSWKKTAATTLGVYERVGR